MQSCLWAIYWESRQWVVLICILSLIALFQTLWYSGLVKLVEEVVLEEIKLRPSAPIYLVGDSIGSALALSVAARNPEADLILILANPGTSSPAIWISLQFTASPELLVVHTIEVLLIFQGDNNNFHPGLFWQQLHFQSRSCSLWFPCWAL